MIYVDPAEIETPISITPSLPRTRGRAGEGDSPHSPEAVATQYRKAVAGALEMLRFGAMLIEVDSCLTRETAHVGQRNQHTGETLKGWLEAHCPEVNYKTAMRFKALAQDMIDYIRPPAKLPPTLLLPGPDGTPCLDDLPESVNRARAEKLQRQIWEMVQGSSARQLMFDFRSASSPAGGDRGGGGAPRAMPTEEGRRLGANTNLAAVIGELRRIVLGDKVHLVADPGAVRDAIAHLKDVIKAMQAVNLEA